MRVRAMLLLWIILVAVVYFVLLGSVLVFFVAASKINDRWDRAIRESSTISDDEWHRAA
jgi:hypothetical protein